MPGRRNQSSGVERSTQLAPLCNINYSKVDGRHVRTIEWLGGRTALGSSAPTSRHPASPLVDGEDAVGKHPSLHSEKSLQATMNDLSLRLLGGVANDCSKGQVSVRLLPSEDTNTVQQSTKSIKSLSPREFVSAVVKSVARVYKCPFELSVKTPKSLLPEGLRSTSLAPFKWYSSIAVGDDVLHWQFQFSVLMHTPQSSCRRLRSPQRRQSCARPLLSRTGDVRIPFLWPGGPGLGGRSARVCLAGQTAQKGLIHHSKRSVCRELVVQEQGKAFHNAG